MNRISIRASELDRVLRCPGSLTLNRIVTPIPRDDGHEGTYLHWAIARRAIDELGAVPPEGGLPPPDVPTNYKLPVMSEWIVSWAITHLKATVPPTWSLMVEVAFYHSFDRWDNTGHADIVALSPDATEAYGADWKTGRDPIDPAEENEQFADYMAHIKLAWPSVRKCTFQGCQPRVVEDPEDDDGDERITTAVLEGDDLERLPATIDARVCEALGHPMDVETGRAQCRWCSAALQCPAAIAERESMKITMTDEQLARVRAMPDDAVLGDWLISTKILTQPMKDAREVAKERIAAAGYITATDGTVITAEVGRGSYKVERPLELWTTIRGLLSEAGAAVCCRWSVTALKAKFAEEMQIPKTSKSGNSAEAVFDAQCRTHMSQNERVTLKFR